MSDPLLFISEADVQSHLSMDDAIEVVGNAFKSFAKGYAQMPPKLYLDFKAYKGDLRAMPAYLEDLGYAGLKWVNSHEDNPGKGLPAVMAHFLLNDPKTGACLALISATELTRLRTGAAGAVAADALAREDAATVFCYGAGRQAYYQCLGLLAVRPIERVLLYDKNPEVANMLKQQLAQHTSAEILCQLDAKADLTGVDILVTTTPSHAPIVQRKCCPDGLHINAIGADAAGKQELDPDILKDAFVFVDDRDQAFHSGEVNLPLSEGRISEADISGTLGDVLIGRSTGRTSSQDITVFDSTGLAIQDLAAAAFIYEKVKDKHGQSHINF